jgi:hypothetical protein
MTQNTSLKPIVFWIVGVLAAAQRLFVQFSHELIPGLNGGYNPLQVRHVLEHGTLGFPDMPLLFYLDAGIVGLPGLLGIQVTDEVIMTVVKLVDALSFPLLLFAVFALLRRAPHRFSIWQQIGLAGYAVVSMSPLFLLGDMQKNSLGIVFAWFYINSIRAFLEKQSLGTGLLAGAFLLLAGLTHFGTFAFLLAFTALLLVFHFGKKALLPLGIVLLSGVALIALFDMTRFYRLINIGMELFHRPALLGGRLHPPVIASVLITVILMFLTWPFIREKRFSGTQKSVVYVSLTSMVMFSFPLIEGEHLNRLSNFLYILHVVLLINIIPLMKPKLAKRTTLGLLILTALTFLGGFIFRKMPALSPEAYTDLNKIELPDKPGSQHIVIARHGLEWWTAWALRTKVGQERAVDKDLYQTYEEVYFLRQINLKEMHGPPTPFPEPEPPEESDLVYRSEIFELYKASSVGGHE